MNLRFWKSRNPRRRPRNWIMRSGRVLCMLLTIAWIGSGWYQLNLANPNLLPQKQILLWVRHGCAYIKVFPNFRIDPNGKKILFKSTAFFIPNFPNSGFSLNLWPFKTTPWVKVMAFPVYFPLWLPLLLVATPTGWLWWRDWYLHRFPENQCQRCGYLLTGLTSQKCPECGTKLLSEQRNLPA